MKMKTATNASTETVQKKKSTQTKMTRGVEYTALLQSVTKAFEAATEDKRPLFMTAGSNLNDVYLAHLPTMVRQEHDCHACRDFINKYGRLVTIAEDGSLYSVMWSGGDGYGVPLIYEGAFASMRAVVEKSRIIAPFVDKATAWGRPATGAWHHLSVVPDSKYVSTSRLKTPGQLIAEFKEDYKTMIAALQDVKPHVLDDAVHLFEADALAWGDKFVAPAKWLRKLFDRPKGRKGENLLWLAIATAPAGYKHPRSSVLWPLLEGIKTGHSPAVLKRKFGAMVNPTVYQRPQAPPSAGNVKQAEEVFKKLGLERALERRFARLSDFNEITWSPKNAHAEAKEAEGGVFGSVKTRQHVEARKPLEAPTQTMTWDKFQRTVLPNATKMQVYVPYSGKFIATTTAVHADAPPIMKWDGLVSVDVETGSIKPTYGATKHPVAVVSELERNPVAWYVYPGGSSAHRWGLTTGWADVTAVVPLPTMKHMPFLGTGYVLLIKGAVDRQVSGNALFPECLKNELHGVRATIEAYSRAAKMQGSEYAAACGWDVRKEDAAAHVRAMVDGRWCDVQIDRWD